MPKRRRPHENISKRHLHRCATSLTKKDLKLLKSFDDEVENGMYIQKETFFCQDVNPSRPHLFFITSRLHGVVATQSYNSN